MAHILVVDDEKSIRNTLAMFLTEEGHQVTTAAEAEEAITIVTEGDIDVVVSDIVLPRITGVTLLQTLRDIEPEIQVIMMTGDPTVETAASSLRAGAFDYLQKPVRKEDLLKTVTNAVKLRTTERTKEKLEESNRRYQHDLEALVQERTAKLMEKEQQLLHAQKMEAIGTVAGGVAHDFNNLLAVIGSTIQLLKEEQQLTEDGIHDVAQIENAVDRASELTRQLLAFSRKQKLEMIRINLGDLVTDTSKMLRRLVSEDIELSVDVSEEPYIVIADATQIEQVIMNLVVNARDAIPKGGRISIGTTHRMLDPEQIDAFGQGTEAEPGPYVVLRVEDNGAGMDSQTREHIFDPFFTTKATGQGTGLGLSTVYGIVRQHGGFITVESSPGKGTMFEVFIPETVSVAATCISAMEKELPAGDETLLCVEDDAFVRLSTERICRSLGYTVHIAETTQEAIQLIEEYGDEIDLLLADVVMPGVDGIELANQVARTHPRIKVMYMSGHPLEDLQNRGFEKEAMLLHKPFTRAEMAAAIRRALDNH